MTAKTQQMADMFDMLPEQEQNLAFEVIKRMVLAWDPDFTRLTPSEKKDLEEARKSGYTPASKINWDE